MIDEAVVLYNTKKENFINLLDEFLNIPVGTEKYLFMAVDYILLGEVLEDE